MHTTLLAVLIVAGAGEPASVDSSMVVVATDCAGEVGSCCGTAACGEGGCGTHRCWLCDWCGPMPQTCYSPRFGCYPGNGRDIHRYPAFHGYHSRKPYNYRHYFEYPWHAQPHEPLGYSVYRSGEWEEAVTAEEGYPTPGSQQTLLPAPDLRPLPPMPGD
ncbi:MAG: hypothetical protein ACYTG0_06575 [Planctomycetota bacterium]|jgi:hypothetical protein